MSFLLTLIGLALLVVCLTGVGLGVYMASDTRTREPGALFACWWISGVAGAAGVLMRDGVTFLVGLLCFLVAGAAFLLFGGSQGGSAKHDRGGPRGQAPEGSEKTTRENRSGYRRAAS